MDWSILEDEIANDPLGRGYIGMTDEQVADDMNSIYRQININIPLRELIVYLLRNNKWGPIKDAAEDDLHDVHRQCEAFMVVMNNVNFTDLDISDPVMQAMLLAIKNAGLLNNEDQSAILAMGKKDVSRAQELGLSVIKPGYVGDAR